MADVTVNIRGDASGLRDELNNVSSSAQNVNTSSQNVNTSPSSDRVIIPPTDRLIDSVRNEIQGSQNVNTSSQNVNTSSQNVNTSSQNVSDSPSSDRVITPPTDRVIIPPTDRLIDSVRNEIQGSQNVSASSAIENIRNEEKARIESEIRDKYNSRRDELSNRRDSDYDAIDEKIAKKREEEINRIGNAANDPLHIAAIDSRLERERDSLYEQAGRSFDEEEKQLNEQEQIELTNAEGELTNAIKELTEYFKRQSNTSNTGGSDPDSYINQLRDKRKQALQDRDNAGTREEAEEAARRLNEIDEELRNVNRGGESTQGEDKNLTSPLQVSRGLSGMMGGLQSGNISSTIMGGGTAIAGLSGMSMQAAMKFLGWVGLAAGTAEMLVNTTKSYESLSGLAAFRSTTGLTGGDASEYLGGYLPNAQLLGRKMTDFGYDTEEFGGEAAKRVKARGMSDDWFNETMRQVGLERNFALDQGSLMSGSKYDRYGVNVTDALTRMVGILSQIEGSGVSMGDFTRVQEKYDIQQQLMGTYYSRTDKPDYDVANQMLAAFSSVKGVTQDERTGSDIASFQNMIQNPMNERMRALVYSTVADLFPDTGGRMDLIDRELKNPENEGQIMKAVIQRISNMFGGTETTMGYFAFKSLLPDIAPERLDNYIKQFSNDEQDASKFLGGKINQQEINDWANKAKDPFALQSAEFTTTWTKGKNEIVSKMDEILGQLTGTVTHPKINSVKTGK